MGLFWPLAAWHCGYQRLVFLRQALIPDSYCNDLLEPDVQPHLRQLCSDLSPWDRTWNRTLTLQVLFTEYITVYWRPSPRLIR